MTPDAVAGTIRKYSAQVVEIAPPDVRYLVALALDVRVLMNPRDFSTLATALDRFIQRPIEASACDCDHRVAPGKRYR